MAGADEREVIGLEAVIVGLVVTGAGASHAVLYDDDAYAVVNIIELGDKFGGHIDLGFPINGRRAVVDKTTRPPCTPDLAAIRPQDKPLLIALEDGLPLVSRPYREVGEAVGLAEDAVIDRLGALQEAGIVRRLGIVVRHRAVGFSANAMAVWDVPDDRLDEIGQAFAAHPSVTLCYRRRRVPPDWPYSLFVMVHAKERDAALAVIDELNRETGTAALPQAVLFSRRCFKQRGARLSADRKVA